MGGGNAGGEVGDEEGLSDAGVADEESEGSEWDSSRPEPVVRFGLDVAGEAEGSVEVGVWGLLHGGLRLTAARWGRWCSGDHRHLIWG